MISITVRTLDAGNHQFSVEDHLTVAEFKKQIEDVVNIPADRQRIIYCGRVLQNNSKLTDCDVDGKVVHLVQRAPPTANGSPSNSSTPPPTTTTNTNTGRGRFGFRGFDPVNNAVYMGSMSIPQAVMNAQQLVPARATYTLSSSRLNVAKRMLRNAELLINSLEHPNSDSSETSPTDEPAEEDMTPVIEARVFVPSNGGQPIDENAIVNAVENSLFSSEIGAMDDEARTETNTENPTEGNEQTNNTESESATFEASSGNTGSRSNPRPAIRCRGTEMANLITKLNELQNRFSPFLTRYQTFMREDPAVSQEELPEITDLLNKVSQILHLLGHAYHSLSDVIINADHAPPRSLLCRPILIQQSAVVQTGIPIQVEAQINLSTARTTASTTATSSSTNSPTVNTAANSTVGGNTTSENSTGNPTSNFTGVNVALPPGVLRNGNIIQSVLQAVDSRLRSGLAENLRQNQGNESTASTNTTRTPSTVASPPVSSSHPTTTTTQSHQRRRPIPQSFTLQPGLNQNAATRRFLRPHMHMSQQTVQSGFDPFLPCYSHHVNNSQNQAGGISTPVSHFETVLPRYWSNSVQTSASTQTNRSNPSQRNEGQNLENLPPQFMNDNEAAHIVAFAVNQAMRLAQEQVTSQGYYEFVAEQSSPQRNANNTGTASTATAAAATAPTVEEDQAEVHESSLTVDQILQNSSYVEGENLVADFLLTMLRTLPLRDIISVTRGNATPLQRRYNAMQLFVRRDICQNDTTDSGINRGIDRIMSHIGVPLDALNRMQVHDDIDVGRTIEVYIKQKLRKLIQLLIDEEDVIIGAKNFLSSLILYAKELFFIILRCSRNGQQDVENVLYEILESAINTATSAGEFNNIPLYVHDQLDFFRTSGRTMISSIFSTLNSTPLDISNYIIKKLTNISENESSNDTAHAVEMEIDDTSLIDTVATEASTHIPPLEVITDTNPLPQVEYDSEQWHRQTPQEWIPVITRDIQKQGGQCSQPPVSDSYLSGMPTKRRKIISTSKPQGGLSHIISETVCQALEATGLTTTTPVEIVADAVGQSTEIRAAYRTLLQSAVQANLSNNEDFTREKFPNTVKYFHRKSK